MGVDSVDPTLKGSILNGFRLRRGRRGLSVLEVTDATVSYLKALLPLDTDPATAIRIEPSHNSDGDALITFRPVKAPHAGDVQALATDLDVFVAPEVAETLASSVLDVAPDEAGRLVLRAQVVPV
jgi:hypothetical protein